MKFDAALWPVPPNVEIHFYFQCMREPQFYKTRTILDKMMLDVGMFPDRVATAGDMIPSHFCWVHPAERPASGVFRRQTGHLAMDLAGSEPDASRGAEPRREDAGGRPRAEARRRSTGSCVKTRSPPISPSLDCLFPPRLRNGGVEDGEESHHVPLAEVAFEPFQDWQGLKRRATAR